jgi:feruloyl-CoA synthase
LKGLVFDGRLAEDFKLSTGTWVSVGPLRSRFLAQAAGLAQDVVIAAPDRDFVAALVFPNVDLCRAICTDAPPDADASEIVRRPEVRQAFERVLADLAAQSTGSSTFIARAVLLDTPPSLDAREITDKGSLNLKAVLQHRSAIVDELYAPALSSRVIAATAHVS